MTDWSLDWSAVEAIATAVAAMAAIIAAFIVIPQLRRLRSEETSHKVEGYNLATHLLESDLFVTDARALQADRGPAAASDWFKRYPPRIFRILRTMEILDFLIQEGYLDEAFLFRVDGFRLSRLAQIVANIQHSRNSPRLTYWSELYPGGQQLLDRSIEWRSKQKKLVSLRDPENPAASW